MPYKCIRGLTCKKVVGEVCCFQKTIKDRKTASYGVMVLRILYYSKNKIQALMGEIKKIKCEGSTLKKSHLKNKC